MPGRSSKGFERAPSHTIIPAAHLRHPGCWKTCSSRPTRTADDHRHPASQVLHGRCARPGDRAGAGRALIWDFGLAANYAQGNRVRKPANGRHGWSSGVRRDLPLGWRSWLIGVTRAYALGRRKWLIGVTRGPPLPRILRDLSSANQERFFCFFVGMQPTYFGRRTYDHLDRIQVTRSAAVPDCSLSGITSLLRFDLGQSQSGNSSLSPQAYRAGARPPNWPYRRFYRSPLSMPLDTPLGAPLWALRSWCERWQDRSVASRVLQSNRGQLSFHIIIY
jgi:hypothetical protein